ncbi:hypothetical protein TNCV_868391 [Trichonephila clavipes]|nr:hypothetical protein TNCV_868391 [Trichonephila clavipes]
MEEAIILECRLIRYWTDKLAGCVGGTESTRNHIGILDCKCRSYELWCKEAEEKNRNSNTLMGQKTNNLHIVLQQVAEITTRSSLADQTAVLHGIPKVLEDYWHVGYSSDEELKEWVSTTPIRTS